MTGRGRITLKAGVWAVCLAPLAFLAYRAWTDDLGANPISFITNTLGDWTLRILLASLAMTPLRIVFGLSWPITLGMLALLSLIPLAATSTTGMIRRLGARNWTRLHRLAYVAAVCAVLHYLWLAKVGVKDPYRYAAVLVLLLGIRGWEWARRLMRRHRARPEPASPRVRSQAENPLS